MTLYPRRRATLTEPGPAAPDTAAPDTAVACHGVHFYDRDEALLTRLEQYVLDGLQAGESTVVIATPEHRQSLRDRLETHGHTDAFLGLDARGMLSRFMIRGMPDAELFDLTVGTLVRSHGEHGRVRAYGEMVALLWAEGRVEATCALERLWTGLQEAVDFDLLCAYPATAREAALEQLHTHVDPQAA